MGHLTVGQRQRVRMLRGEGLTLVEVARRVGCSLSTVERVTAGMGKREDRRTRWQPGPCRLSLEEREEISLGLRRGESFTVIAGQLGRSTSTVSREVNGAKAG